MLAKQASLPSGANRLSREQAVAISGHGNDRPLGNRFPLRFEMTIKLTLDGVRFDHPANWRD
jgi:hypothetical protein